MLLWAKTDYLRPSADDWDQLFGLPRSRTEVPDLPTVPHERELERLLLSNSWRVPCVRLLLVSLFMYFNITIDTVLLDTCFDMSVPLEAPHPAQALLDLAGQDFIEQHVPPPQDTLAMHHRHLFEPSCSCTFLQWAISGGCHCSGLYLPLLQGHARPRVNGLTMPRSSAFRASCALASLRRNTWRNHCRSTVHPLDASRDPIIELAWALAFEYPRSGPHRPTAYGPPQLARAQSKPARKAPRTGPAVVVQSCSCGRRLFQLRASTFSLTGLPVSLGSHGQRLSCHREHRVADHFPPAAFCHVIYASHPRHGQMQILC